MKATVNPRLTMERLADKVAGEYKGFLKYVEGNNLLGTDCNAWTKYGKEGEMMVQVAAISSDTVDIFFYGLTFPDFVFTKNVLIKDEKRSGILIEGDWITGWGVLGRVDIKAKKLVIDINPVQYGETPNSGISPESLVSRYVMVEAGSPQHYKTVFNLEFEGIKQ